MYFYLFIYIEYVLRIFRLPTADLTQDMFFFFILGGIKIDCLID